MKRAMFAVGMAVTLSGAADGIDPAEILRHTRVLASDAFEGRAPGTPGEEKTVDYLVGQFRGFGLQPGGADGAWTQDVPIVGIRSAVEARLGDDPLVFPQDFSAWAERMDARVEVHDSEVVFAGYGVAAPEYGWDDYKGVDVRGKTVVVLVGDPPVPDPKRPGELDPKTFQGVAMTYYGRWTYKFEEAARRGAAAALIVHETKPAAYPWFVVVNSGSRERFVPEGDQSPRVAISGWLSLERASRLFESNGSSYSAEKAAAVRRDFRPKALRERFSAGATQSFRTVKSRNVLARLEGSDRRLRLEHVVYTAHWDHLGQDPKSAGDGIFNGAADNAIGTAGLLELARHFARAPHAPRRSILFLAVTAEEQGLIGSAYYAAHPVHPLAGTVANINMDGLNQWGRTRDLRVVGLGSSTLDAAVARAAAARGRIVMPEEHPERGTFFRSDHFEFMKRGVPALYVKAGSDYLDKPAGYGEAKVDEYIERDYHKPSDEVKPEWDLSGAAEDLEILADTGRRVADARHRPAWKRGSGFGNARDAGR